ncbi:hypothetical protein [Winogradskyella helgolandensis]|uniref:hypothetical protein n=1 Tax=Winogradskyella helgolandensis TaxID=2697010 RepID=UPI0015C8F7D2|nr:hypothetical protein [Winogradskyella helgolandensis]
MKIGDIVEYHNEFGLIIEIPKTDNNGKYLSGDLLVQWDTENENDIENCIGNLEGFLKIVDKHEFKFIKLNEQMKK